MRYLYERAERRRMSKMVASVTGIIKRQTRHSEYLWNLGIENGFPAGRVQPRRLSQARAHELTRRVHRACDYEGLPVRVSFDEPAGLLRWTSYTKAPTLVAI